MADKTNDSSDDESLTLFVAGVSKYSDLLRAAAGDLSPAPVPPTDEERRAADAARMADVVSSQTVKPNTCTVERVFLRTAGQRNSELRPVAGTQPTPGQANRFTPSYGNLASKPVSDFARLGVDNIGGK